MNPFECNEEITDTNKLTDSDIVQQVYNRIQLENNVLKITKNNIIIFY